ncbi:MAG: MerR family transcriptional regulator [Lachnospiraceae bacterium]|nr:MerR family transcriptional regulator [Lachnospiraceae bacterium]
MSNYTTGEMAKLCNVSVRTVQFYDTKGILHPSDLTEGGRRIFNDEDLRKLQVICTLKAIGLSLNSIKSIMESELSGRILTILLDEQEKLLGGEIEERQKQLEMINIIKENIHDKTIIPANTILGIEDVMENRKKNSNKKKLVLIFTGVGVAAVLGLLFMIWLIISRIWWGLIVYIFFALFGILVSVLQLKDNVFICPKCDSVFKPSLARAYFSTGSHKIRWMTCPECGNKDWCVLRKQTITGKTI